MYGEDAEFFLEEPHYTLVCDAREVESEEEEVQLQRPTNTLVSVPYSNK